MSETLTKIVVRSDCRLADIATGDEASGRDKMGDDLLKVLIEQNRELMLTLKNSQQEITERLDWVIQSSVTTTRMSEEPSLQGRVRCVNDDVYDRMDSVWARILELQAAEVEPPRSVKNSEQESVQGLEGGEQVPVPVPKVSTNDAVTPVGEIFDEREATWTAYGREDQEARAPLVKEPKCLELPADNPVPELVEEQIAVGYYERGDARDKDDGEEHNRPSGVEIEAVLKRIVSDASQEEMPSECVGVDISVAVEGRLRQKMEWHSLVRPPGRVAGGHQFRKFEPSNLDSEGNRNEGFPRKVLPRQKVRTKLTMLQEDRPTDNQRNEIMERQFNRINMVRWVDLFALVRRYS